MRIGFYSLVIGVSMFLAPSMAIAEEPATVGQTPTASPTATPSPAATPSPSPAQVSPINSNRPTQGTNTGVVGPHVFQLEMGLNNQSFKGGGDSLTQFVSQFRFGLSDKTELFFTVPVYNSLSGNTGTGDTNVGFKWDIGTFKVKNGNAVIAVVPNATFTTGALAFRNPGTVEQVIFSADIPTGKNTQNLTLNLAPTSLVDPATGSRFTQLFYAAYETVPVSGTTSAFLELSGFGPDASVNGIYQTNVDFGMTFLVNTESQFDFDILKGLSVHGTDWFFTVGFSHRFR